MPATLAAAANIGPITCRLHPAGNRDVHGQRLDQRDDCRPESRQQRSDGHDHRRSRRRPRDHACLPGERERGTAGLGHGALHQQWAEHRERHHLHLERRRQSRGGADGNRSARGRELRLRSRDRRDHLVGHAGNPRRRREHRPDHRRLHPAGICHVHGQRLDQRDDHRPESRQQRSDGHDHRRSHCRRRRETRLFRPTSTPVSRSRARCSTPTTGRAPRAASPTP